MNEYLLNLKIGGLEKQVDGVTKMLKAIEDRLSVGEKLWNNSDVIRNWGVSERTLASWRSKKMIGHVKVNGKIYYTHEDRERFLKVNRVPCSVTTG